MAAINPSALQRALDMAGMTQTQLVEELGRRGVPITLSYLGRILAGSRRLKRNPVLRTELARALNVPIHWIEVERPDPERVA